MAITTSSSINVKAVRLRNGAAMPCLLRTDETPDDGKDNSVGRGSWWSFRGGVHRVRPITEEATASIVERVSAALSENRAHRDGLG